MEEGEDKQRTVVCQSEGASPNIGSRSTRLIQPESCFMDSESYEMQPADDTLLK